VPGPPGFEGGLWGLDPWVRGRRVGVWIPGLREEGLFSFGWLGLKASERGRKNPVAWLLHLQDISCFSFCFFWDRVSLCRSQ
jgi:hypothetical protein